MWTKPKGEYPDNWETIKESIIVRANYECELCKKRPFIHNIYKSKILIMELKDFRVHHKDLDKSNNEFYNLIFVCKKCHGKLHRKLNEEYSEGIYGKIK